MHHHLILDAQSSLAELSAHGGGKARNMALMSRHALPVPPWFCVGEGALQLFLSAHGLEELLNRAEPSASFEAEVRERFERLPLPESVTWALAEALKHYDLSHDFVAVRSSGLDEDSATHSFAGQFSTFLFQKGCDAIGHALKLCWASGFSARALAYRRERGLSLHGIGIGVVVQRMIHADRAGVAFSRHPIQVLARNKVLVSSVFGAGEGLVSGLLDADDFIYERHSGGIEARIVKKTEALEQSPQGGLEKKAVGLSLQDRPSLTNEEIAAVARLAIQLEETLGCPQDCEWVFEKGRLYLVQTRPITSLPPDAYYNERINGREAQLWDNSNIIESYSGVTTPLTFSFASRAYNQVYIQFCEIMGVPASHINLLSASFRNLLGLIRGRMYYNLIHWYELVLALPGSSTNKGFMETMMGVKQSAGSDLEVLFANIKQGPRYSWLSKIRLLALTLRRFRNIDVIIANFFMHFQSIYEAARKTDMRQMSLPQLAAYFYYLEENLTKRWHAPIINDYLCMIFFGLLKKFTQNWFGSDQEAASLQNDLLCGEGGLDSTEPTKFLMRLAEKIDTGDPALRSWFLESPVADVILAFKGEKSSHSYAQSFHEFLDRFGFRCVNELKLEEPDLHDDPGFVIHSLRSFIQTKSYHLAEMEKREKDIRAKAEAQAKQKLSGLRLRLFWYILKQARKAVKNRENLRFARTKTFGISRHLFRAMGAQLVQLGFLDSEHDIFYLTVEEILAFIEGRVVSTELRGMVALRRKEYDVYQNTSPPPDRFLSYGGVGMSIAHPAVLMEADLLRNLHDTNLGPNQLAGTPCCPGVVEGVVRVVHKLEDAVGLGGEILVTARTDPGWVPLFPACSGLLVERGSLLSHSAVVARELGLPTIVGINGGLLQKLKTGDRIRMDAGKGEITILEA
jgi:phosphohistidine swiveling domain-containing protein